MSGSPIVITDEVRDALTDGAPIVAMETTIFSRLGLPTPRNAAALEACLRAVRQGGAVPAITAVLDGAPTVGVEEPDFDRILAAESKVARRDLPIAVASGLSTGVTTVSASLALAAAAGVEVFATGGIGGVHRAVDGDPPHDVSADLAAIAAFPLVTVSAGAKILLDLAATLEHLETLSVPVLGLGTDDFPAFHARSSGLPVPARVETPGEAAAVLRARLAIGDPGGVLLAVPVPEEHALPLADLERAVAAAHDRASEDRIHGAELTPYLLAVIADETDGRAVDANVALAEHNARVAAEVAGALTMH
ncbi:MAG: pseudouridine-5'-phosphate glycosidase [Nitriliruptorales bacterium]|nr:pseudouridine-5'-phosphate glycosidase [Nitriliruptorales bacterium]